VYYSLKPTTVSKEVVEENTNKEVYIEKYEKVEATVTETPIEEMLDDSVVKIGANIPIEIATQDGYFKSNNKNIKIEKRNMNVVVFSIPFGVTEVVIEVKEKGDIVEKTYRVV
jgi:hypothetical protein